MSAATARCPCPLCCAAFGGLGYGEFQTYIQSGNVVFGADAPDQSSIEAATENKFGFHVGVILRTSAEWASLTPCSPYPQEQDGTHLHVAFLNAAPGPAQVATIRALPGNTWEASGRELYLHTPGGMGQSELNLGQLKHATVRNWRTVQKLGGLLG